MPTISYRGLGRASKNDSLTNGKPTAKRPVDWKDLSSLGISLICLVAAIYTVHPSSPWAWSLAFDGQIVVVGVLLGIMNLITQAMSPLLFLLLEYRFGESRLQNYEAILTKKVFTSRASLIWRSLIVILTILPIFLGAAYKQFLDGESTAIVTKSGAFKDSNYGPAYPPFGELASFNNSIYEQINSIAGFIAMSQNDTLSPNRRNYPIAAGYNVLLLDDDSAAMLDMPTSTYILSIRNHLRKGEMLEISAPIDATVASRNDSIEQEWKTNDTYFNATYRDFRSFLLYYNSLSMGMYSQSLEGNQSNCLLGVFQSAGGNAVNYSHTSLDDPAIQPFRQSTMVFSLARIACNATWRVNSTSVTITQGTCDKASSALIPQDLVVNGSYIPFELDTLPVLVHSISQFFEDRVNSTWARPAFAVSIASAFWARMTYILHVGQDDATSHPELYTAFPEGVTVKSTVPTLRATWLLYLVLAVHPTIAFVAVVLSTLLCSVPIGRNFGLVSILAGIDHHSLPLLAGAGLSGKLETNLNLEIWVDGRVASDDSHPDGSPLRIRYSIHDGPRNTVRARLKRNHSYG